MCFALVSLIFVENNELKFTCKIIDIVNASLILWPIYFNHVFDFSFQSFFVETF